MAKDENYIMMAKEALDSAKSAHKRLDEYGEAIKNMNSIALDVKGLAGDVKLVVNELTNTNKRVEKIECHQEEEQKKPSKLVDTVKIALIVLACNTVLGAILALIIK